MDSQGAMWLVYIWCALGVVILAYAVIATVKELRSPKVDVKSAGYPLFSRVGEGFFPRLSLAPSDQLLTRVGKVVLFFGWYALSVALAGIALAALVSAFWQPSLGIIENIGQLVLAISVSCLLIGYLLKKLGAK